MANWNGLHAFEMYQQAISNCQELYFMQTIHADRRFHYSIDGYVFMVTNVKVRVIRYFSRVLQGAQLNWSAREKEFTTM